MRRKEQRHNGDAVGAYGVAITADCRVPYCRPSRWSREHFFERDRVGPSGNS
jgi:hypothetical protein